MNALPLTRRLLTEAIRTPVTVSLLIVVPVLFVAVAARSIANSATLLGSSASAPAVQVATAGWAAAFIAAIAMYFQMRGARAADRRLVLAGLAPARLVAARLATGLILALVATGAALAALAVRTGIPDAPRVLGGTVMFAVIYLAIGALVGALVSNPVNGTVLILFLWLLDLVLGPAFGSADRVGTRVLPTHFVTLWMIGLPSHHAGRLGDLGIALVWTLAAFAVSAAVITRATRTARTRRATRPGSIADQMRAGVRMALREAGRNRVLWALLIVVPAVFVLLARFTTPNEYTVMPLTEAGHPIAARFWFPDIHPGLMAPIAIAALAAIGGLSTLLDTRVADKRLTLAGYRPGSLLASRLVVISMLALLATAASLAMTATVFTARQWVPYIAANILIALTYALVGVILGALVGRVGAVLLAFALPFLDLAITQSPMLHPTLPGWAQILPGYGGSRLLYDAALTSTLAAAAEPVLIALAWLAALTLSAVLLLRPVARRVPAAAR